MFSLTVASGSRILVDDSGLCHREKEGIFSATALIRDIVWHGMPSNARLSAEKGGKEDAEKERSGRAEEEEERKLLLSSKTSGKE